MKHRHGLRTTPLWGTGALAVALAAGLLQAPAVRADEASSSSVHEADKQVPGQSLADAVEPDERAAVLGEGYRTSGDRAWTTSGDATGFHVLVAEAKGGYRWKTAATLSEPGFDTDAWIGNACVTESGTRAVVAYAPRTFTNKPELMSRGAFTAVVDLGSGKVTKLPVQSSLAYFSPGCGHGERAVLSQLTDDGMAENATRLITVDAAAGRALKPLEAKGQITSAIPYDKDEIVAADGTRLVKIDKRGKRTKIADTAGIPFQITKDAADGISYLDRAGREAKTGKTFGHVRHVAAGAIDAAGRGGTEPEPRLVASGELTALDLTGSASGEVFVTGKATSRGKAPVHVHNPGGLLKETKVSTRGRAAVASRWAAGKGSRIRSEEALTERTVTIDITVPGTGKEVRLGSVPGASPVAERWMSLGRRTSPALAVPQGVKAAADPHDPVESERTCSVPRGDVRKQAFQPTPRQVEWAVDQAVINGLDKWISRPANWKNTGMAAYRPQALFPLRVLSGDPNGKVDRDEEQWHIPAQILLGITAQESNMWQATRFAVPGVTSNPLIGNYYGIAYGSDGTEVDPWRVDWAEADCGYGITQVTDGMRLPGHGQPTLSETQQEAVALDYTANIAAGADILAEKWNQTRGAGLIIAEGSPRYLESWFFALWAYNSGFYPQADAGENKGKWGVGWTNNPANPLWKANRLPFLEGESGGDDYSHAAHPQDWPYQEKVLGWAARPISALFKPGDMQPGYRAAWWSLPADRSTVKPPVDLFCDASNECDPSLIGPEDANEPGLGACEREDLYCWWNKPARWKLCSSAACGNAIHRFNNSDYPEQPDENSYPPRCISGLPTGSLIVDDLPNGAAYAGSAPRQCSGIASRGTFEFTFANDGGQYPGKIDTHQIGAGYGNHFWFSHTRDTRDPGDTDGRRLSTTGTWTLDRQLGGWARVMAHIPDHGAHTRQARYIIRGTDSTSPVRVVPQRTMENRWVELGVFRFTGTPQVSLSTDAQDGDGSEDVAWDAVAFQPLSEKPDDFVVAMGDSYSSGEGASAGGGGDYYRETDWGGDQGKLRSACHRSRKAWSRQAALPGNSTSVGERVANWDPSLDFHMTACSGAKTHNLLPGNKGGYGELAQLDQGYLDQNTTLVTLSIGGNDARFADIVSFCAMRPDCHLETMDDDSERLELAQPKYMRSQVTPKITEALGAIKEKAPNARIVLMGYPLLFSESDYGRCIADGSFFSDAEVRWFNEMGGVLTDVMTEAAADARAAGVDVTFADPAEEFSGKGVCDDPETIHGVVTDLTPGDDPLWEWGPIKAGTSAQSFHPKIEGARLYADALEKTLRQMGSA
ncbi:GDSL-type esterase/lipase family protein [Streptomyces sp. NPDC021225]|uniref:GDSL-type esterase/lipase family protein n=1 Tax=Streptomyces sp. NPDC021225 TaxID=3365121 RepID=UPI00378F7159